MQYHKHFGAAAPNRGWIPAPRYLLRRFCLLRAFQRLSGSVLEIGCGSGAFLLDLHHMGFSVQGLETSPQARHLASIIHNDTKIPVAAAPDANWDNSFDIAAAFEVLEHIKDDNSAIRKWTSWIKPGGHLVLSVPAHQYLWNENDTWAGHYRRYNAHQLATVLEAAGLRVEHTIYYGFPVATLTEQINGLVKKWRNRATARQETINVDNHATNTERSGADRKDVLWLWPILTSPLGYILFRFFDLLQRLPFTGAVSGGVIVVARKPEAT